MTTLFSSTKGMMPVGNGPMGVPVDTWNSIPNNMKPYVRRDGGVLRYMKGSPNGKGGQIVGHIKDMGMNTGKMVAGTSSKLLLGLTGIGAVASVANLAVSAVGFYMMNKKLNALSDQMDKLHETMSHGFDRMEERFVQVQYVLGNLAQGQQALVRGQEEIKDQNDAEVFSTVISVMDFLQEKWANQSPPTRTEYENWRTQLANSRNYYRQLVEKWCTGQKEPQTLGFARGTGYYQYWTATLIAEARLLRMVGETELARDLLIDQMETWYYPTSRKTAELLIDFDYGVLTSGPFEGRVGIQHYTQMREFLENSEATMELMNQWSEEADRASQEYFGDSPRERVHSMRQMDPRPFYSKAVQVYGMLETGKRVETMALEYDACAKKGLPIEEWEYNQKDDETGDLIVVSAS